MTSLTHPARAIAFGLATLCVIIALTPPLMLLSQSHFLARTVQQVLLCIIAPPLLWLACSFHVLTHGAPGGTRRWAARWLVRPSGMAPALHLATHPGVVWLLYLSSIVLWHDPAFVDATVPHSFARTASLLWLFAVALLFWQQITANGPRRYTHRGYIARLAMLVTMEMANVATGIIIAFAAVSIYGVYQRANGIIPSAPDAFLPPVADQFLGGVLTWLFGSVVYITSAVLVVNQVFRREGVEQPQPISNWDADEKFIMPGLEDRLREQTWERHDWKKH
jgi:cytochrome c oxidase assembly factor CtaG